MSRPVDAAAVRAIAIEVEASKRELIDLRRHAVSMRLRANSEIDHLISGCDRLTDRYYRLSESLHVALGEELPPVVNGVEVGAGKGK